MKFYFIIPSMIAGVSVVFGAIGSHALKGSLSPDQIKIFNLAVTYQFFHCFALFISAWRIETNKLFWHKVSFVLFLLGILLFSGSLYLITIFDIASLRKLTPVGGSALIIAWLIMAFGFYKEGKK